MPGPICYVSLLSWHPAHLALARLWLFAASWYSRSYFDILMSRLSVRDLATGDLRWINVGSRVISGDLGTLTFWDEFAETKAR